jgi:hypothetical protein
MAGGVTTRKISGRQLTMRDWTQDEIDAFERDFYSMISQYSKYVDIDESARHVIADIYYNNKEQIMEFGQLCGQEISPNPGAFGGMVGRGGYVMRQIRPDDILETTQGRTFDYDLSSLTANNWYAVLDDAAIGGTVTAAIYMRKFLGTLILGVADMGGNPLFDELQWLELEGSKLPIDNMHCPMRFTDLSLYEFPAPIWLRPEKKYQCSGKVNATAGVGTLSFIGVTFIRYEQSLEQQPSQPATTPP